MNIDDFEEYIDRKILNRGYDYYIEGHICGCHKEKPGTFIFDVAGSDDYEVSVELKDNYEIKSSYCDCPYDFGPICKHEASVFYYLRNNIYSFQPNANDERVLEKEYRNKGEKFEETLSNLSKEQLIEIIRNEISKNSSLKDEILMKYFVMSDKEEIIQCKNMISLIQNKYSNRRGFVDYRETYHMIDDLHCIIDKINDIFIERKNCNLAVDMAFTAIDEFLELEQDCYDHNGGIHDLIINIIGIIENICDYYKDIDKESRVKMFKKILNETHGDLNGNCDNYENAVLKCCISFCDIEECRNMLESEIKGLINKYKEKDSYGSYEIKQLKIMLFEINNSYGDEKSRKEFIIENYNLYGIRKSIVADNMTKGDYNKALKIVEESEKIDKDNRIYLRNWKETRYEIYGYVNKIPEKECLAREMLLDGYEHYYDDLKKMHKNNFDDFYKDIIIELRKKKALGYSNPYLYVILKENDKAEIMDYVRKNPYYIEQYVDKINKDYKEETETIYKNYILKNAERASERKSYKMICSSIRKYKRLYGDEKAFEIIGILHNKYRKRSAFMDELSKIK